MSISNPDPQQSFCSNCGHALTPDASFCPGCGQKSRSTRISFKELLGDFFDSVFNVNSKFFLTLTRLFNPGFLTREFFRGKQIRYFSPLRLFFVTLVAMYAVLGITYLRQLEININEGDAYQTYRAQKEAVLLVANARNQLRYDTLSAESKLLLDTLEGMIRVVPMEPDSGLQLNLRRDSLIVLTPEDVYELEVDSVIRKYDLTGFWDRLITRQLIRARREPAKAVQSLIGNTSWMILLLMPALALWMKMLYLRRKKFYVEHIVFLFHYHAAVFVSMILFIPLIEYLPAWTVLMVVMLQLAFLYTAMLRYYGQHWFKTLVKFVLLGFAYFGILLIFSGLTVVISLMLFQ